MVKMIQFDLAHPSNADAARDYMSHAVEGKYPHDLIAEDLAIAAREFTLNPKDPRGVAKVSQAVGQFKELVDHDTAQIGFLEGVHGAIRRQMEEHPETSTAAWVKVSDFAAAEKSYVLKGIIDTALRGVAKDQAAVVRR